MDTAGLYIHVPFCVRKCPYCDFYSVLAQDERIAVYTAAVCRNLREYASLTPIDSIYFGGGNSVAALPEQVAEILAAVADAFPVSDDTEVTLEANPATLDTADLGKLRKAGINRLSLAYSRWMMPVCNSSDGFTRTAGDPDGEGCGSGWIFQRIL